MTNLAGLRLTQTQTPAQRRAPKSKPSRRFLLAGAMCLFAAPCAGLHAQATAGSASRQDARNQTGEVVHAQPPSALPGPYRTMAEMKQALETYDAVFAAYSRAPLLSPPRGFVVINNYNADARNTPRGWPIPVGSGLILLAYDGTRRLPNGRFATEAEGPTLGSIQINQIDCGNPPDSGLGEDATSKFYFPPKSSGSIGGWPKFEMAFGWRTFMTRRTQPQWLPVTVDRVLNVQLAQARAQLKTIESDTTVNRAQNAYTEWLKGKDERLRQYQATHDLLAKTNQAQADQFLANALKAEEQNGKNMAALSQKSGGLTQEVSGYQAQASKKVQDLEARSDSLTPQQRSAPRVCLRRHGRRVFARCVGAGRHARRAGRDLSQPRFLRPHVAAVGSPIHLHHRWRRAQHAEGRAVSDDSRHLEFARLERHRRQPEITCRLSPRHTETSVDSSWANWQFAAPLP